MTLSNATKLLPKGKETNGYSCLSHNSQATRRNNTQLNNDGLHTHTTRRKLSHYQNLIKDKGHTLRIQGISNTTHLNQDEPNLDNDQN